MRVIFSALLAAGALCAPGCANEGPTAGELQEQLRRGVSGEGQLTSDVDRTNDPYVKPREGRSLSRE